MSKGLYMRTITAGRYQKTVRYTRALPGDAKTVRAAKQAATNAAQKYINIKNTTENLQLLLCANFDRPKESCFCTFTFKPGAEPANQKHAGKIFAGFVRKLRPYLKDSRYIYVVEGTPLKSCPSAAPVEDMEWEKAPWRQTERWEQLDSSDQGDAKGEEIRLHIHCFLNLEKGESETVRALWPYGQVYISQMKVNEIHSFSRLASYVTKEKRDDKKGNGARAYIPSKNLEKPVVTGHWCAEHEGIVLPQGAEAIKRGAEYDDVYGSYMEYLYYRLPRPQQIPEPYKSKGKIKGQPTKSRPEKAE